MADQICNISKGRFGEFVNRVDANDPANAVLVIVLLRVAGTDDTLRGYDTLGAMLATETEANFTNYARVVLNDTNVALGAPDDTNDRYDYDIPDPQWVSAGGASNNNLVKLVVCYDSDSTAGTDTNIIPMSHHDFVISTNGGTLTGTVNAAGFARAA